MNRYVFMLLSEAAQCTYLMFFAAADVVDLIKSSLKQS
jgi:hypothetical protein